MIRLFTGLIIGLAPLILGAALMWGWDNRPAGWPGLELRLGPFHPHLGFGLGLRAQRDRDKAAFATQQASIVHLEAVLRAQDTAIQALHVSGLKAHATSERAVLRGRTGTFMAAKLDAKLSKPIPGLDECSRVESFDRSFKEALK